MGKPAVAPVMMDGVIIGYVTAGSAEDVSPNALGSGSGLGPAPSPSDFPEGTSIPHQRGLGDSHGRPGSGVVHHHRIGGPHEHARHKVHVQHGEEPVRRGPTFRRGIGPGSDQHDKAPGGGTFPTIKFGGAAGSSSSGTAPGGGTFPKIEKGGDGTIDRSHHREYLKQHPEVREKLLNVMIGEHGTSTRGMQMIAEETMNRADVRGHSLEQTSRYSSEPGGYSAGHTHGTAEQRANANKALESALSGSNENKWATDNSSGSLARSEAGGGEFTPTTNLEGEYFWTRNSERAAHEAWKARQLARVGTNAAPSSAGIATQARPARIESPDAMNAPGAMNAPNGQPPAAFIVHHTGGHGTAADVVHAWENDTDPKRHGVGTQYIMDREGVIHDVAKEFGGAHVGHRGQGHFLHSVVPGVSNRTALGMEIIAYNDADITAKQRENAIKFIQSQFSKTTPYGHSEVSPGDRTNEGVDIARTIRQMRANAPAAPSTSKYPLETKGFSGETTSGGFHLPKKQ